MPGRPAIAACVLGLLAGCAAREPADPGVLKLEDIALERLVGEVDAPAVPGVQRMAERTRDVRIALTKGSRKLWEWPVRLERGRETGLSLVNRVSYVSDYDLELAHNLPPIHDLDVETTLESLTIGVQPLLRDEKALLCRLHLTVSRVARPMRELRFNLGPHGQHAVGVPELERQSASYSLWVHPGRTTRLRLDRHHTLEVRFAGRD